MAVLTALLAACSGSTHRAQAGGAAAAELTASPATAFADSVGVNVHFGYLKTSYRNTTAVLQRLSELGVHYVRDSLPINPNSTLISALSRLPDYGMKADLAVAQVTKKLPSPAATLASLDPIDRQAVDAIEAPNEWDHAHSAGDWVPEIVMFTRKFGKLLHASPEWGKPSGNPVPFVGPSTDTIHLGMLPDLGSVVDIANLHDYTAGGPPEHDLGNLDKARATAVGKPLWVTELGFHTAVNQDGRQPAVTEAQQGSYLARQLLENFTHGVARSYVYQLLDDKPDPSLSNQERHFGLLLPNLKPKQSYTLLRNLLTNLRSPGPTERAVETSNTGKNGVSDPPNKVSLNATIATPGDGVGSLLLRRGDGSYALVLWARGALNLDGTTKASNAQVAVKFTGAPREVSVVRTSGGKVSGQSAGTVTEVSGRLGGDPVIINVGASPIEPKDGQPNGVAKLAFDATGLAPGAATVPHGNVGQLPSRVKNVLVWGFAFVIVAVAVTMSTWLRRRRRGRR